jgi:hypothetical protein
MVTKLALTRIFFLVSVPHRDKSPQKSLSPFKLQLGHISFVINAKHFHVYLLLDVINHRVYIKMNIFV